MSMAVKKHISKKDQCTKRMLKALNALRVSRFCCIFSLRQGTLIIAITQVALTSIILFLMLLGATHAQDTVALVTSDLYHLEESGINFEGIPPFIINNENKMISGQHLAFIIMFIVWAGLLLTTLHFISCILLLYGTIRHFPSYFMPWITSTFFGLITSGLIFTMLTFAFLQECKLQAIALIATFFAKGLYIWFVVFSYYRELKTLQLKKLILPLPANGTGRILTYDPQEFEGKKILFSFTPEPKDVELYRKLCASSAEEAEKPSHMRNENC